MLIGLYCRDAVARIPYFSAIPSGADGATLFPSFVPPLYPNGPSFGAQPQISLLYDNKDN